METKQTEDVILRAAEKLFLEQGFKETTTAQIAKEAGCNSALVHYYFRTKENLFAKVFTTKVEEYAQGLFGELEGIENIEQLVRRGVEAHWSFMASNVNLALFMFKEVLELNDRTRYFIERHMELREKTAIKIEGLMTKEAAQGHICPISSKNLLQLILSLDAGYFFPIVIRSKAFNQPLSEEELHEQREEAIRTILARLQYHE